MDDKQLVTLLELADRFPGTVAPDRFIRIMRVKQQSPVIYNAMWQLFCKERRIVTIEEAKDVVKGRRAKPKEPGQLGRVKSHFFDSGSFALWTKAAQYAKKHNTGRWDYYDTDEFWKYMDDYAAFVKAHPESIDYYANVDVIPNPELSYRNLKYLEDKHGLNPVPVVHFTTDLKWLRRYMQEDYEFIALGGLVGSAMKSTCREWLNGCFNTICDAPDRLPKVKLHGFGLTAYEPMLRYPWWSVDSTAWAKVGVYGLILVPRKRRGQFVFNERPLTLSVTTESPDRRLYGNHLFTLPKSERMIVEEWLEMIGVAIGETSPYGERIHYGITNSQPERILVNIRFFERMVATIPEWPWPYRSVVKSRGKGLGLI